MKTLKSLMIFLAMLWFAPSNANTDDAEAGITAEITFTRTSKNIWRVAYKFSAPVSAIDLGPAVANYRTEAWTVLSPNVQLVSDHDNERLVIEGAAVTEIVLEAHRYTVMPEANYMPFAWFSDNGASMYLGHFMGDVETTDGLQTPQYDFILQGRSNENTLMPLREGNEPVFAYFGPQVPVVTDSIVLIADPGLPTWLRDMVDEIVPVLASTYASALQIQLPSKPVVMIAAGDIDIFSQAKHMKGGALKRQFNLAFAGLPPKRDEKEDLQKLIAHEMAHVWQRPEGINDFGVPWVYEGGADAMAVAALQQAGIWTGEQVRAFSKDAAARCEKDLGGMDLDEAEANNNWAAAYSCGYAMYAQTGMDVLTLWALMVRHPDAAKTGYTPEILSASLPIH